MAATPMPIDPTDAELDYRAKNYPDWNSVKSKQIACATCGKNLGAKVEKPGSVFVHPFTTTLQCKKCSDFYGDGDFSMDEDGDDKYCRMCGNGGELYICGNKPCPYGLCQKCVDRYIGKNSREVEADDWKCIHCNCKPLWEVRAVCAVIILEKSRKRSKHRKIPTRHQVTDLDDHSSRIEDLNSDSESSIRANRRSLKSLRKSKKNDRVLENLAQLCNSNGDDSLDQSDQKQKFTVDKKGSNTANKRIESRANPNCVGEQISTVTSQKKSRLRNKLPSSESETIDSDKSVAISKKHDELKFDNVFLESKSVQRQGNKNSSDSIRPQGKMAHLSQKHPRISRSPESYRKSLSNSDSESSHESANDFVISRKKKDSRSSKKNSNPKDSAMRTQRSNNLDNLRPKTELKHSNTKFGKSLKERKTHESSLESKGTSPRDDHHPIKEFSTTKMRNKTAQDKHHSSESDDQMNGSNKRATLIKKGAHRVTMKKKLYSNSENEENVGDESQEISTKVLSSTPKTSIDHHNTDKYSVKESNNVTVRNRGVRRKHDSSDSSKEIENPNNLTCPIKKGTLQANRKSKRYTDSENEDEDSKTSVSTIDAISKRVVQTKRSSSKLIHPASETSSSLDYNSSFLDRRKASIKRSYAKLESIEDCVTKNQASVIKDHVSNLMSDIKIFGKCLCAGAEVIVAKQLTNNVTSVSAVSKTVLKCALIMIRAKKSMEFIESEFIKSYENWCKSCKVKSIFSDVEPISSDAAISDNVESVIREKTHANINKKDQISKDRADSARDHSAQCSDASNHNDENCNQNNQLTPDISRSMHITDKTQLDTHEKSIDDDKDSDHPKSLEKIDKNKRDSINRDNNEAESSEKNKEKIDENGRDSANRDSDEVEDSDKSQGGEKNVKNINKNRRDSANRDSDEMEDSDKSQGGEKNLKKIDKTKEDSINRISDKDSINSRDNMSDCDSKEIFSEDEDREQPNKIDEPVPKRICMQSTFLNTSGKQSIALDSDEFEKDNLSSKTLEGLREKSVESDGIESPTNVQDSRKRMIESMSEKSIEEASRNDSCIVDSDELTASPKNLFDNITASDYDDLSNLKKKSKDSSSSNQSFTNCSETTEYLSLTEESAPCNPEVRSKSPDKLRITDDNETSNLWGSSVTNERKSSNKSTNNGKSKNSIDDSSPDTNEDPEDLSDCDMAEIFTQIPSDDSTTSSTANHTSKSKEIVTNTIGTEDSYISDIKIASDVEIPSINDNNSNHEVVSPSKEASDSSETIAERFEGVDDSDTNKNSKEESGGLKSCRENQTSEIVGEKDSAVLLSDNEENVCAESIGTIEEEEMDDSKNKRRKKDEDSEEALKKKILESDSESSDDSTAIRANNFVLKVNSDSEEYAKEAITADSTIAIDTSDISSVANKQSQHLKMDTENREKKSFNSPQPVNTEISELNKLAKHRLLSSSTNSSSSETDDISLTLPDNDEIAKNSATESGSTSSRTKKKKLDLENNYYYKTNKKLQMDCKVTVRRLNEKVLDQFKVFLRKSKDCQEWQKFKSLVDLNNLKKRKRGTKESNQSESSSESSSSTGHLKKKRSKQEQEKEETLLDHLEKMKNGENFLNPSGDESDDNDDLLAKNLPEERAEEKLLSKANEFAKDLLIQSSDSENEAQALTENAEETDEDEDSTTKTEKQKKKKDISNDEAAESESNNDNESNTGNDNEEAKNDEENEDSDRDKTRESKKMKDGLAKRNWRLTDSDSSSEEKKWNKSQEKKLEGKSNVEKQKDKGKEEEGSKQKKKIKRRVLGSDSDSVILTDLSDSSDEVDEEKKNSSSASEDSSEIFKNLRTKRRRKRNAGQKTDSDSQSEDDEKPAKQKRKRIKKMAPDSDSDDSTLNNSQDTQGKLHRKNIRKVLKDKQVADVTKIAGKEEEERLKRIADRQKLYNEMYELKLASEEKVDKLILDFDEETKKELVSVHENLVSRMKPHQAQGIKFMWDACFESLERTKSTKGSGCIVAHCMGLGKTFQVVTLAHTLLTHPETGIKTIMVICPLSTVLNWVNEFKKWLGDINNDEDVEVFEMTKMKKNFERKYQLETWQRAGGVMILGYEMFRLLSNQTGKKMRKSLHERILKCLVDPGPDLIVCDEGHLLKNEDTALSKAMRRVKTLRRIVLTGTPLQNNLVEYHCMVQFVKPNLLGTKKEFLNRFVNPITNGQFDDSTEYDVKLMKKRAHVLHKMLEGSVQRFDYSVLTPFLPPKQEYVITVRLTDIQIKLYQYYLDNFSRAKVGAGTSLFADFQALQRIWTHPIVLRMNAEKMEKLNEKRRMDYSDSEGSLKDFLDDGSDEKTTSTDEDSDIQSANTSSDEKIAAAKPKRGTRANPIEPEGLQVEEEEPQSSQWWSQFIEPEHFEDMKISSKLVLLFAILKESEQIGDKVLVFSQSLYALSLIEEFLNKIDDETQRGICSDSIDGHIGSWSLGLDYFRLDGQTPPENRSHYCKIFNNPKNSRARLFLISTRAGGLGINLTAANRVIIFDASWNPSHDVQSIFRIYRFGQKKPCYVYRFLAQGTMEEKIYNRQVTKLSLSCRVVDEQQIERHYSNHDLAELYQFEPNTNKEKPTLNLPKDRLLAEIFRKYEDRIETFHEHDSLLENKAEEELDEEERKEAWKEYEDERTGRKMYLNTIPNQNFAMQPYDMMNMNQAEIVNRATLSGINIDTLQALIRKDYPNTTPEQQTMMTQRAIMDMYTYMENEAIRQQQMAAASFTYPTVSNIGTGSFVDQTGMTPAQRQYALQQQQRHQMLVQREQQANYAKRFGNVRGPALSAAPTRTLQVSNVHLDDNDVIEVPTTPPPTAGPAPSSSIQAPPVSAPAAGENSKRQEE